MTREATVQLLARDALGDVERLIETIARLIVGAEPPGFYDEESEADLRLALHEALVSMLGLLAGDETPSALEPARTTGRRQVQQNLPLEGALRAYRLAGQALWQDFVARARAGGAPVGDALLDGAGELWRVVDDFCGAVAQAYREEERTLRDRDERVQSAVLGALLEGRGADPQFARDAKHALGLAAADQLVCVVGLADSPDTLPLDGARERLRAAGLSSVWATFAGSDVGVVDLGSQRAAQVRQVLAPAVRIRAGMSPVFSELADLPRAHRLAEIAAACAGRGVRVLEDDLVAGLVVDAPLVPSMLVERTVERLLSSDGQDGPTLLATVRAFLEADGSLNTAAQRMFVHRNTMLHRINRIEKITGLSLRSLDSQVLWVLALRALDVRSSPRSG